MIVGIEARGFIVGSALATKQGIGFVPIRKKGKLPGETNQMSYELEYGTDSLEIQKDSLTKDSRVLIVDDLLATGGTSKAACELVDMSGGLVVGLLFVVELLSLNGRKMLPNDIPINSIIPYK